MEQLFLLSDNFMIKLPSTLSSENGAITIVYAIIFPALLAMVALALDGALMINRKARLADASSEAILAISAVDNRLVDSVAIDNNKQIAKDFVNYYLPNNQAEQLKVVVTSFDRTIEKGYIDYKIAISATLPTLLPLGHLGFSAFDRSVTVGNFDNNSGNARKFVTVISDPADYVFVVDFSDSMNSSYIDQGRVTTRLAMLKQVVREVISGNKNPDSQFAIVPFDIGVPFRIKDSVNTTSSYANKENEGGGELVGCSALYVPKPQYAPDKIDYNFWANKNISQKQYPLFNNSKNSIFYNLDRGRYFYYRFIVGKALNEDMGDLEDRGWCTLNSSAAAPMGLYTHSCEAQSAESIFPPANKLKIEEQYDNVTALLDTMRAAPTEERSSIANSLTIDYASTLKYDNLFGTEAIQEFIQPWAPNMYEYRAFTGMCQSATPLRTVSPRLSQSQAEEQMAATFTSARAQAFLIPLTTSSEEKTRLISDFAGMSAGGGTDSTIGLLRSVPVVAAGTNPKKVIIVISDGEDEIDPAIVADQFHSRGMCDVIKAGLKDEGLFASGKTGVVANTVEIHYVSINDNNNESRMAFWGKYCARGDDTTDQKQYTHTATNYSSLIETLVSIIGVETGFYIQDSQNGVDFPVTESEENVPLS